MCCYCCCCYIGSWQPIQHHSHDRLLFLQKSSLYHLWTLGVFPSTHAIVCVKHSPHPSHLCPLTHRMNLYELIKKNHFQGFSLALIRRFAYALLQCLKLLQRERIIHCDLKPVSVWICCMSWPLFSSCPFPGRLAHDGQICFTLLTMSSLCRRTSCWRWDVSLQSRW